MNLFNISNLINFDFLLNQMFTFSFIEIFSVGNVFRLFSLLIDSAIYLLLTSLYNIFIILATNNILDNSYFSTFVDRIMAIVGLIMLFKIAIVFVQMIFDPNKISDDRIGGKALVKKIVVVIVLLTFTSNIFDYAYKIQNIIIKEDIIPQLILGSTFDVEKARINVSTQLFSSFVYIKDDAVNEYSGPGITCDNFSANDYASGVHEKTKNALATSCANMASSGNISALFDVIALTYTSSSGDSEYVFEYTPIIPFILGVFVLWIFANYTFSIATRMIKLIILQIISPVAIISYISVKHDQILSKWFKICIETYLKLFLIIGTVFFALSMGNIVLAGDNLIDNIEASPMTKLFIKLIVYLALLLFAQSAPKFICDIFNVPMNDDLKNLGKITHNPLVKASVGGVTAGAVAGYGNAARGIEHMKATGDFSAKNIGGTIGSTFKGTTNGLFSGGQASYRGGGNMFHSIQHAKNQGIDISNKYGEKNNTKLDYQNDVRKNFDKEEFLKEKRNEDFSQQYQQYEVNRAKTMMKEDAFEKRYGYSMNDEDTIKNHQNEIMQMNEEYQNIQVDFNQATDYLQNNNKQLTDEKDFRLNKYKQTDDASLFSNKNNEFVEYRLSNENRLNKEFQSDIESQSKLKQQLPQSYKTMGGSKLNVNQNYNLYQSNKIINNHKQSINDLNSKLSSVTPGSKEASKIQTKINRLNDRINELNSNNKDIN